MAKVSNSSSPVFLCLWKYALKTCFLNQYPTNNNGKILQYKSQLGPWMTQIQWKW